jgi:hypothetical protein
MRANSVADPGCFIQDTWSGSENLFIPDLGSYVLCQKEGSKSKHIFFLLLLTVSGVSYKSSPVLYRYNKDSEAKKLENLKNCPRNLCLKPSWPVLDRNPWIFFFDFDKVLVTTGILEVKWVGKNISACSTTLLLALENGESYYRYLFALLLAILIR